MKKTVLVTGASGNLGSAVVRRFAMDNYKILACVSPRHAEPDIANIAEIIPLDLSDEKACWEFCDRLLKSSSLPDAVVLTAGGFAGGSMDSTTISDFEKMIALNFYTAFNLAKPLFNILMANKKKCTFVLIGSEPGTAGGKAKGSVAYGFSKSLLFRLAELIDEAGKSNSIQAHVVIPGTMDTPQNRAAMPHADFKNWRTAHSVAEEIYKLI